MTIAARPALARLAPALALAVLLHAPARAETVAADRFGCRARELTDRLFQLVAADEAEAFGQLLRASLANGDCRAWTTGEEVRVEGRAPPYACLAEAGAAGACYWTPASAIEPAR